MRTSSTSTTPRTRRRCRTSCEQHRPLQQLRPEDRRSRASSRRSTRRRPYHLGANTTWLVPEHDEEAARRSGVPPRARHVDQHQPDPSKADQGLVDKASPTGLLPDLGQVDRQEGLKQARLQVQRRRREGACSPRTATGTVTATASSRTRTGRTSTSGSSCPNGWSDWMTAIQVIADSAKAAGIKITPEYPGLRNASSTIADTRKYDLLLDNDRQYSNTPWTYYQYIFQLPIPENQTTVNYERYVTRRAWNLTKQLDKTPTTNKAAYQADRCRSCRRSSCRICPRFRSGTTACGPMVNTQYWTNWPSSKGGAVHADLVAELLADDRHRHAHASCAPRTRSARAHRCIGATPLPARRREGCCSSPPFV